MQSLRSNRKLIYYSLYLGNTEILDSNGRKTGEKRKTYSKPQSIRIFVSPAKGTAEVEQFGINDEYTNIMSTFDTNCPIKEDSILWIDQYPFADQNEEELVPYTHTVHRVAPWNNSISYAIKKVSVSGQVTPGRFGRAVTNVLGEWMTDESNLPIGYII